MKPLLFSGVAPSHRAKIRRAWPTLPFFLLMASCGFPFQQANLQGFVETASTSVLMRSLSFESGSGALARIPSGKMVTGTLVIINPKSFDITYSLCWDVDNALFITRPPVAPLPDDPSHISLSFALDPAKSEHKTIAFKLGMYIPSINRNCEGIGFSVICDSPPNPVSRAGTVMDSFQKSILAVLLPTQISDDDLSKLKISWTREGASTGDTATYDIAALSTAPNPNPFSSKYDCFFQASDCVAGYGYTYSVVVIDKAGQESSPVSTSSTANSFYLNYDGNGATGGTAPASVGYRYGEVATAAPPGDLAKTSNAFSQWNSKADGTGTGYAPGDSLRIPAGDLILYAQWITNTTDVAVDLGTYSLTFSMGASTLSKGSTLSVSCANAALVAGGSAWKWYIDGMLKSSGSSSFSWVTTDRDVGQHIIGCSVILGGIGYSGSFRATVTQ